MARIKDLDISSRPREKAMHFGLDKLSDVELLAVIIGSGTKGNNAIDIAYAIISSFGGLNNLKNISYQQLLPIKGISKITALKLSCVFKLLDKVNNNEIMLNIDEKTIFKKYSYITDFDTEVVIILILNRSKQLIFEKTLFIGSENKVILSLRQIIKEVLINNGSNFYLIHNHPNGVSKPSLEDIELTNEIAKESKKIGINLIDHFIITKEGICSLIEHINFMKKCKFI